MFKKTLIFMFVIFIAFSFTSMGVLADSFGSIAIEPDNDYIDEDPKVCATYIVWTRGKDMGTDGVSFGEASWIMLHDITTGETKSISETYDDGFRLNSLYYHSEDPDIYGDKIIYEYKDGLQGHESHIRMYNITQNETWIDVPVGFGYTSGYDHVIYDDWLFIEHNNSGAMQGIIYNYETGETFNPMIYSPKIKNPRIHGNWIAWTLISTSYSRGIVFNLDNYKCIELPANNKDGSPVKFEISSLQGNNLVFSVLDQPSNSWNLYSYNLMSANWTGNVYGAKPIVGNIEIPTMYSWEDIEGNVTEVNINSNVASYQSDIWLNKIYYVNEAPNNKQIYIYDINKNTTRVVLDIPYEISVPDVYFDKVVWSDDRSGELNIYRLTTNIESFSDIMIKSIPVIMVAVVVVLFWKAFDGGLGGAI